MFREQSARGKALTRLQATIVIATIVCAVVIGVYAWWATKPELAPPFELEENPVGINIKVEAVGAVLHYQEELFWSESQFSEIVGNQNEFSAGLIENFTESLSAYSKHAENITVIFNEARKSAVLRCDVHGAISKSGNRYTATFFWLLKPLGLDFIDSNFKESKEELSWEGVVSGIPTTITLEFPPRDDVYAAWHHPNGHCHAHVWWESS
jgi:hypothetical protein